MEILTLRAFVEVVRQGGFSQAAKTVFIPQSTVSKAVKQLEDEIGTPLLDRIGHRSKLMAAGEIVYRRAIAHRQAERDDLIAELQELRGLKRGIAQARAGARWQRDVVRTAEFAIYREALSRHRHPAGGVRQRAPAGDLFLAGRTELAGLPYPSEGFPNGKTSQREPLTVLLPAGHTLSRRRSVDLPRCGSCRSFCWNPDLYSTVSFWTLVTDAASSRLSLRAAARSISIVALVAAGMGTVFLPRMIAEQRKHPSVARVLLAEADMDWHIAMIWRRGALSHAAEGLA